MISTGVPWYASAADRAVHAAAAVNDVENWPVDDAAAVIGVETAWLAGLLLGLKFLIGGLVAERRRVTGHRG